MITSDINLVSAICWSAGNSNKGELEIRGGDWFEIRNSYSYSNLKAPNNDDTDEDNDSDR